MKVHHLNCGCMCPLGAKLFPKLFPNTVICHCLLVESRAGLILIDTGFAKAVYEKKRGMGSLGWFLKLTSPVQDSALLQIQQMGFSAQDVRHLIPTHLDHDHAGGIEDFPDAIVHTSDGELQVAQAPKKMAEKIRYSQFKKSEKQKWQIHCLEQGENWFGFKGVRAIPKTEDEILLIPLLGHTPGHFGVAIRSENKWLLHVGDAYYNRAELSQTASWPRSLYYRAIHSDYQMALANQRRLLALEQNHGHQVEIFCAHDPQEMPTISQ